MDDLAHELASFIGLLMFVAVLGVLAIIGWVGYGIWRLIGWMA